MAKEKGSEPKAYLTTSRVFACVLAAGLLLVLAPVLLHGGKMDEAAAPAGVQDAGESVPEDDRSEDTAEETRAEPEPEKEEIPAGFLEVKEMEGETEDITLGVDVSKFQETIDWAQVAESGVDFAMVRVGCRKSVAGEIVEDECARYNLQEAAASGILLGAYFFSTAVNEAEAEEEADWVCEFLKDYPITYPVVYNCEGFQEETSRQYGMTVEERTRLAQVFLDKIEEAGYTGMFYAARSELQDSLLWDTEALEQRYRIWVAQYLSDVYPNLPNPEYDGKYAMWQYTDQGTVPGIRTVVDLNVAYFGYEETAAAQEE